jgi:hypothetical protein
MNQDIQYLRNREIDRNKWDKCIDRAVNHRIYGYSWYLDLVCKDWDALILNDYSAVFPLPFRRKLWLRYVYTPWFVQQLGLFFTSSDQTHLVDNFIDIIRKKFFLADIYLHDKVFPVKYHIEQRDNFELSLFSSYQETSGGYSENLRRNLKQAQRNGLKVIPKRVIGDIITLFRLHRGAGITHWKEAEYQRFSRLFDALQKRGMAHAWGVCSEENNLFAGAVFFTDRKHIIMILSGLSTEGKEKRAMPFLIDHLIREHSETKAILDFEGSMDPGLARFYASFGATREHFGLLRLRRWKRGS